MSIILTAFLATLSTVFYHIFQKMTPTAANPALALSVTYGVALVLTFIMFSFFPLGGFSAAFQKLNWVSYALGLAIVGLEVATLLAYRAGWELSLLSIVVNVVASLVLVILGLVLYKEKLTMVNIMGILVCIAGLVMINYKR